jgi:hemerythrin superfamily protein
MPTVSTHRTATRRRATPTNGRNAITLLRADHRAVEELFDRYERSSSRMKGNAKRQLAEQICHMLTVHTTIEEEIFYPAVRTAHRDLADLLDEANVEHASAKELIAQIEAGDPEDELYDAKVNVLGEYVKHHVKEEQTELFPELKSSRKLDLAEIGARLEERKEELMGEMSNGRARAH